MCASAYLSVVFYIYSVSCCVIYCDFYYILSHMKGQRLGLLLLLLLLLSSIVDAKSGSIFR